MSSCGEEDLKNAAEAEDVADKLDQLKIGESNAQDNVETEEFRDCDEGVNIVYAKDIAKAIEAKEEGNNYFRNKEYDDALESYSRAITFCPEDDKEMLATFYGNRSAAYFALEEYELVVEDCTAAVALKPDYVKVLARRMQANEKLEKYEDALTGKANGLMLLELAICLTVLHLRAVLQTRN
jgi:tetratricopeptide (TPR) repeat protein